MSIEVRGLSKRFGGFVAVQSLDIDIADGEFFVLLGPSGCGKSTTLRMIAGLDRPSSGMVRIRGRDVTWAEPRHRDIAMVFQDYGLYPNMTVFQNIEFPLKVRKLPVPERRRKVLDTAERLGIAPEVIEAQLAHRVPDALGRAYNRTLFAEQRSELMTRWADYLDRLREGAKVIPMTGRAA